MTLDEFVARELQQSGKTTYTLLEVEELTSRWIAFKTAAAAPFEGWDEARLDELMFGKPEEYAWKG